MGIRKSNSKESFKFSPRSGSFRSPNISPRMPNGSGLETEEEATHSQEDAETHLNSRMGTPTLDQRTKNTLHPDMLNRAATELSEMKS